MTVRLAQPRLCSRVQVPLRLRAKIIQPSRLDGVGILGRKPHDDLVDLSVADVANWGKAASYLLAQTAAGVVYYVPQDEAQYVDAKPYLSRVSHCCPLATPARGCWTGAAWMAPDTVVPLLFPRAGSRLVLDGSAATFLGADRYIKADCKIQWVDSGQPATYPLRSMLNAAGAPYQVFNLTPAPPWPWPVILPDAAAAEAVP